MLLFKENEKLITELENQILNLKIFELEEKIRASEIEGVSYGEKIYEGYNQIFRLRNRVLAVNEKIISEQEALRNRMAFADDMCKLPCGIEYMDMPLNNRKYLLQKFYHELHEKYKEEPIKRIMLGFTPSLNGRFLKTEYMDECDKKKAIILDEYLKLCSIQVQLESLIDCIKSIQFNYIPDNIQKD